MLTRFLFSLARQIKLVKVTIDFQRIRFVCMWKRASLLVVQPKHLYTAKLKEGNGYEMQQIKVLPTIYVFVCFFGP